MGKRVSRGVIVEQDDTFGPIEIGSIVGVIVVALGAVVFSLVGDNKKRKGKKG